MQAWNYTYSIRERYWYMMLSYCQHAFLASPNASTIVYGTGILSPKYNYDRIFCRVIVFSVGSIEIARVVTVLATCHTPHFKSHTIML